MVTLGLGEFVHQRSMLLHRKGARGFFAGGFFHGFHALFMLVAQANVKSLVKRANLLVNSAWLAGARRLVPSMPIRLLAKSG